MLKKVASKNLGQEKTAGLGSKGLMIAGSALMGGALLTEVGRTQYYKGKAEKNFDSLFKQYPDLKSQDKKKVREHFEVIKTLAPRFSSVSPLVGPWLLRSMQFADEGITPQQVTDAMEVEERQKRMEISVDPIKSIGKAVMG